MGPKRFVGFPLVSGLLCLLTVFLASPQQTASAAEKISLRCSSYWPSISYMHKALEQWAAEVKSRSKGELTIRIYPDSTLLKAPDAYGAVVKKSVDLASAQLLKNEPGMTLIFRLPALLRPSTHEEGEKMLRAIEKRYANIFDKEWAEVKRLSFSSTNPTVIMTTKRAVRTLEDAKGLQLRAPEATMADIIRAIGATPVFTPISEWIVSLDKGTVDGGITTTITVRDFKLEKYIRHINMWTVGTSFEFLVMNKERFDSLPPHLQKILEETSAVLQRNISDARGKTEKEVEEYCRKQGVQFIYPSPEELSRYQERTIPVYEKIIKELDALGYPGREIYRFCAEMK